MHKLDEAQQHYQLFPKPADNGPLTVVVGVSGGADSIGLLHALAYFAEPWRLRLHVAHLDHNLRPEAADEAAFVAQVAAALHLPFHAQRLPIAALVDQPGGLEATARRARYAFLLRTTSNVTPATQVPLLAVAHQADDQAETLLLHLVRGSGLQGLGGMRWRHLVAMRDFIADTDQAEQAASDRSVQVVRPLLAVRRQEIMAYLQTHNFAWCEDSSNADTTLLRNRVRHEILPQLAEINPNIVETLGRTAQILAGEAERLRTMDPQRLAGLCLEPLFSVAKATAATTAIHRVVLDLQKFLALEIADQRGVLRQALALLQPGLAAIGFAHSESLIEQLRAQPEASGPHPLVAGLGWSVAGATTQRAARLSLHRMDALPFSPDQPYLDETWCQTIGLVRLPLPDQITTKSGQITTPNGWSLRVDKLTVDQLSVNWQPRDQPWQAYLDADQAGELVLTTPRPGLSFAPLGMLGQHKTLGDFFTDGKLPTSLRAGWPLVMDRTTDRVLWVCGLRLAHQVRITAETRCVLSLRWDRG